RGGADGRATVRPPPEQPPYSLINRGVEGTTLPIAQRYGMGVLTWGPLSSGWLSGANRAESHRAATMEGFRFDTSIPENARKVEAVTALQTVASDAGMSLSHMAMAFVRAHPAVTSAIIGPRTMEQLDDLLAAVDTTLDGDILDRVDEIVPPGVDLNPAEHFFVPDPALSDKTLRRRIP